MKTTSLLPLLTVATSVLAAPTALEPRQAHQINVSAATAWNAGAANQYPIHSSCNASEAAQIRQGLAEAIILADHAKQHVLRWGRKSQLYRKYFSEQPTGEVIGNYDRIVSADKGEVLFRCDNPDGNCDLPGKKSHVVFPNGQR